MEPSETEKGSVRVNGEIHERMKALATTRGQHLAFVYEQAAKEYLDREQQRSKPRKGKRNGKD